MKNCKYVKCGKPHERKSAYCCKSHQVRQWELDKKKKPFLDIDANPKPFVFKGINRDTSPGAVPIGTSIQPSVSGGYIQTLPDVYETQRQFLQPSRFKVVLPLLFSVLNSMNAPKGQKLEKFLKGAALGGGIGTLVDYLRPKYIDQRILVEPSKQIYIAPKKEIGDRMTSAEYQDLQIEKLGLGGKYKDLFGDPAKNFYMIVDGSAGHGKSWWVAEFAQHFHRHHGKVVYYAAEQSGHNLAFQEMIRTLKTSFDIESKPKKLSMQQIKNDFNKYDLVVLDSVSEMGISPAQLKELREETNCAIVAILQSTKDGQHKGSNEWLHDVGVSLQIVRFKPQVRKSRYKIIGGDSDKGRVINL